MEVTPVTYGWMLEEPVIPKIGDGDRMCTIGQRSNEYWMQKLADKDMSGPEFPIEQYLQLRDARVEGNPRQTEDYKQKCLAAVGLGEVVDESRYGHLRHQGNFATNVAALRWTVSRGTGCFWLPHSPRSSVRGFKHRLLTSANWIASS